MARIDNLDFLADVIPKTTTYKQFKEKKAREDAAAAAAPPVAPGQTTLSNGFGAAAQGGHSEDHSDNPSRTDSNGVSPMRLPINGSPIADRTLNSSAHGHPLQQKQEDLEMEDEDMQ